MVRDVQFEHQRNLPQIEKTLNLANLGPVLRLRGGSSKASKSTSPASTTSISNEMRVLPAYYRQEKECHVSRQGAPGRRSWGPERRVLQEGELSRHKPRRFSRSEMSLSFGDIGKVSAMCLCTNRAKYFTRVARM